MSCADETLVRTTRTPKLTRLSLGAYAAPSAKAVYGLESVETVAAAWSPGLRR